MSSYSWFLNLLATSVLLASVAIAAPAPDPEPLFNSFLSLFNPSTVANSTSALNTLALSHLNHQLNTLSALGSILGGGGFNFTDSFLG